MILDLDSCPTCGAVTASEDGRVRHAAWHAGLNAAIDSHDSLAQIEEPISTHAVRVGEAAADEPPFALAAELEDIEEVLAAPVGRWACELCAQTLASVDAVCNSGIHVGPAGGPIGRARWSNAPAPTVESEMAPAEAPPIPRHPQVPEADWHAANHEQKRDISDRIERIEKLNGVLANPQSHRIDREVAEEQIATALAALREDYAFELLPAEMIEQADAAFADEPPPARVGSGSPSVPGAELERRRRYLLTKYGLGLEAEQDRQQELAEIERRLSP